MPKPPSRAAIASAVSLLTDASPGVADTCRQRLLAWGEIARASLEDVAGAHPDAELRVAARSVLKSLDLRAWTRQVAALGDRVVERRFDDGRLLEEGVALILLLGRSADAIRTVHDELDRFADDVRRLVAGRTSTTAARNLAAYLAGRQGYRGSACSYYRPENLFLDQVLESREGLPIALAAIYLLVGRRAGLELSAVRLEEDYFLVRVKGRRAILLDPFHAGRSVTRADCGRYLRSKGVAGSASARLRDVDDIHVLLGMMSTLARVHDHREDREFHEALQQAQRSLSLL